MLYGYTKRQLLSFGAAVVVLLCCAAAMTVLIMLIVRGQSTNQTKPSAANARDIVAVTLRYERVASAIARADGNRSEAVDSNPKRWEWDIIVEVLVNNAHKAIKLGTILREPKSARTPCGREVELAYRRYIRGHVLHYQKWLRWWSRYSKVVQQRYKVRGYVLAVIHCVERRQCAPEPQNNVNYSLINGLVCPKRYFACRIAGSPAVCSFRRIVGWIVKPPPSKQYLLILRETGKPYNR